MTRVPSGDGQFWDIQDTSPWSQDSGGIATGGRANPFNGFGYLKLQVRRADSTLLVSNQYLRGFGLHHDGAGRFDSITPVLQEGILIARGITTSKDTPYLRYFDSFTNTAAEDRIIRVAWGGAVGAVDDGGRVDGRRDLERRPADRHGRQLRHRDAEREGARPTRPTGPRGTGRRRTCWARGAGR